MAAAKTVWGVDIGQCALKAVKVLDVDGQLQVEGFEVIEHSSVLSQPDVDVRAVIEATLQEFLRRADVAGTKVAVSVLGQSSFTRFVKLPPVEKKKIPDIVHFEAEQQIPFPIDEVIWRYQTFTDEESPDVEVGIFAMKQADVSEMLSHFSTADLAVDIVQMAPLALYNFMTFDSQVAEGGATMLADVGADKTHLIVSDGSRIWTRTIQIGGNNFTQALVKSFKLSFAKAEKLKRTAASSKYARQIFQVMRPVFADLVQEIQRSIGYYTSLHRDARFKQLVGIGNGFKLPGMLKYLEQNLNMSVKRIDSFNKLKSSDPRFQESNLSFGVAYGLAVQALGEATIQTNLLPRALVRKRLWAVKKPWFVVAASVLVLAAGVFVIRTKADLSQLQSLQRKKDLGNAQAIVKTLMEWKAENRKIDTNFESKKEEIARNLGLRAYANTWPTINSRVAESVLRTMLTVGGNVDVETKVLQEFASADVQKQQLLASQVKSDQGIFELIGMLPYSKPDETNAQPDLREQLIAKLGSKDRTARQIIVLQGQASSYIADLDPAPEAKDGGTPSYGGYQTQSKKSYGQQKKDVLRGFEITLSGRTSLPREQARLRINELKAKLDEVLNSDPNLKVVGTISESYKTEEAPAGGVGGAAQPKRTVGGVGMPGMMPGGMLGGMPGMMPGQPGRQTTNGAAGPVEEIVENPDPLFPKESMSKDIGFELTIKLAVVGDGLEKPEDEKKDENR